MTARLSQDTTPSIHPQVKYSTAHTPHHTDHTTLTPLHTPTFARPPRSATYLDALVYGYVNVIRRTPMPAPYLRNLVDQCPGLLKMCDRIERAHFKMVAQKQQSERKKAEEGSLSNRFESNAVSIGVAGLALMLYTLAKVPTIISFQSR